MPYSSEEHRGLSDSPGKAPDMIANSNCYFAEQEKSSLLSAIKAEIASP